MICFEIDSPRPEFWPKALMRPVGVEALEDPLQRIVADARPVVVDHDLDLRSCTRRQTIRTLPPAGENDCAL